MERGSSSPCKLTWKKDNVFNFCLCIAWFVILYQSIKKTSNPIFGISRRKVVSPNPSPCLQYGVFWVVEDVLCFLLTVTYFVWRGFFLQIGQRPLFWLKWPPNEVCPRNLPTHTNSSSPRRPFAPYCLTNYGSFPVDSFFTTETNVRLRPGGSK